MSPTSHRRPSQVLGRRRRSAAWPSRSPTLQPRLHLVLPLGLFRGGHRPAARRDQAADRPDQRHLRRCAASQVTGGDPTLRKRDELGEIVRLRDRAPPCALHQRHPRHPRAADRAARRGPGRRRLPRRHDPGRRGDANEVHLYAMRGECIQRARGLGLATTSTRPSTTATPTRSRIWCGSSSPTPTRARSPVPDPGRHRPRTPGCPWMRPWSAGMPSWSSWRCHGWLAVFDDRSVGYTDCNRNAVALIASWLKTSDRPASGMGRHSSSRPGRRAI